MYFAHSFVPDTNVPERQSNDKSSGSQVAKTQPDWSFNFLLWFKEKQRTKWMLANKRSVPPAQLYHDKHSKYEEGNNMRETTRPMIYSASRIMTPMRLLYILSLFGSQCGWRFVASLNRHRFSTMLA